MRNIFGNFIAIVFLVAMAGSASAQQVYTWHDVNLKVGPTIQNPAPKAYLKVYTEAHLYHDMGVQRVNRLPYTIYSADGKKIKWVAWNDTDPKLITLPPGKYVIVPETDRTKTEIVGATLKVGKLTEVHLKGENPI
jgi:hypothetical protein